MHRLLFAALMLVVGSSQPHTQQANDNLPQRLESKDLPNLVQVHPKILSGGLPSGDEAFRELHSLGVKTIISVDGMTPDVESARKYGLRYVHLPHGYDGIPAARVKELAKAVRELPGPIYIHCHHGKHRSPAAASVACVAGGLIPQANSVAILELAGTSPHYRGLYQSARQVKPLEPAVLENLAVEFKENVEVPPMAKAMVAIEHTHDHLQRIAESGWRTPPDHPDLDPAHEALLLKEHFTELLRSDDVRDEPAEFRALLKASVEASAALENALRDWAGGSSTSALPASIPRLSAHITSSCTTCHQRFRDIPHDLD